MSARTRGRSRALDVRSGSPEPVEQDLGEGPGRVLDGDAVAGDELRQSCDRDGAEDDQHGADCGRCDPPSEVVSQSEIDTKALEKNRAEERADHARQCIADQAATADEPTREPPGDEPDPDLRGKSPKERAQAIIENCAHPDYKNLLWDYLKLTDGKAQTPHAICASRGMHAELAKSGDMRNTKWEEYA